MQHCAGAEQPAARKVVYGRQRAPYSSPRKIADGRVSAQQHAPGWLCMHGQTHHTMQGAHAQLQSVAAQQYVEAVFTCRLSAAGDRPLPSRQWTFLVLALKKRQKASPPMPAHPDTAVEQQLDSTDVSSCSAAAGAEGQSLSSVRPWVAAGAPASLSPYCSTCGDVPPFSSSRSAGLPAPNAASQNGIGIVSSEFSRRADGRLAAGSGGPVEQGSVMLSPAATATAASAALPPLCRMRIPACSSRALVGMDTMTKGPPRYDCRLSEQMQLPVFLPVAQLRGGSCQVQVSCDSLQSAQCAHTNCPSHY